MLRSTWTRHLQSEIQHVLEHKGKKEIVLTRVEVKLDEKLAKEKGLDKFGHKLDKNGNVVLESGYDLREEPPAEIDGWIEPSEVDAYWTIKLRVNIMTDVTLGITRGQGTEVYTLVSDIMEPGEYEYMWDGLDEDGNELNPGNYNLTLIAGEMTDTPYSYSLWMKTTTTKTSAVPISQYTGCVGDGRHFYFDIYNMWNGANIARFLHSVDDNSASVEIDKQLLINGSWHHIAFSFNGSEYSVYVDGLIVGNATSTSEIYDINPEIDLVIGGLWLDQCEVDQHYQGLIDEVRICDRALTEEEVQTLADAM